MGPIFALEYRNNGSEATRQTEISSFCPDYFFTNIKEYTFEVILEPTTDLCPTLYSKFSRCRVTYRNMTFMQNIEKRERFKQKFVVHQDSVKFFRK